MVNKQPLADPNPPADYPTEYDGPVYVGPEQDEPELVDADVDEGPVPAAGERKEPVVPPVDWALAAYLGDNEDEGYPHPTPPVVQPEPGDRPAVGLVLTTHADPEEYARIWNLGYAEATKQWEGAVAAAVAAVRADLEGRERQIAAVEQALDVEGWVIERGAHDRGVQIACQRIRRALADPESFLNPTPASATKETK